MADDAYRLDLFTKTQQAVLGYTPLFTAPFSVIGSAAIIVAVLKKERHNIGTYERLMLATSTFGFFFSLGLLVLGPWAVPKGVTFVVGARGNIATCNAAGFLLNFLFGTMIYSLFLAIYFLLVVKYGWTCKRLARWLEPIAHFSAINVTFIAGCVAWVKGQINPVYILPGYCWSYEYPPGCSSRGDATCLRGSHETIIGVTSVAICWIGILFCMIALIFNEKRTEARLNQFTSASDVGSLTKTRDTTIQALQYIGAFSLVFFPIAVIMFATEYPNSTPRNRWFYFVFGFLVKLLSPLHGFLNAIIYLYPRASLTERGWVESLYQAEGVLSALGGQVVAPIVEGRADTVEMAQTAIGRGNEESMNTPTSTTP